MSQIAKSKVLSWTPSVSTDVAKQRIYYGAGATVAYTSPFVEIQATANTFDTALLATAVPPISGTYTFAVSAVDAAGNESDLDKPAAWVSLPLDLVPPLPPTGGSAA